MNDDDAVRLTGVDEFGYDTAEYLQMAGFDLDDEVEGPPDPNAIPF